MLIVLSSTFILLMISADRACADSVHPDSIRTEVINALYTAAGQNGLDIEVSVPYVSHIYLKSVDKPVMSVKVPSGDLYKRSVLVKVEFIGAGGEVIRRMNVVAHVKTYATVAVAAVDVERGKALSLGDVVMKRTHITGISTYFVSPADVEGMRAKRKLKKGDVITKTSIEFIPLINRGDKVTVKACIGNITIKSVGQAREDGGLNETIRVYNKDTKKTIYGIVIDPRTVLIGSKGD